MAGKGQRSRSPEVLKFLLARYLESHLFKIDHVWWMYALGGKDELIRFWLRKVKGQGRQGSKCAKKPPKLSITTQDCMVIQTYICLLHVSGMMVSDFGSVSLAWVNIQVINLIVCQTCQAPLYMYSMLTILLMYSQLYNPPTANIQLVPSCSIGTVNTLYDESVFDGYSQHYSHYTR